MARWIVVRDCSTGDCVRGRVTCQGFVVLVVMVVVV